MNIPVNFETSKKLKEKGFDKSCFSFYRINGKIDYYSLCLNVNKWTNNFAAPTIVDVVSWLYEKHNIWMWVEMYEKDNKFTPQIPKANLERVLGYYDTPEEAYVEAIEYCLNNLL